MSYFASERPTIPANPRPARFMLVERPMELPRSLRTLSVAAVAVCAVLAAPVALMSLVVPGCASCNCPNSEGGRATVQIPAAQSSPIVDAMTNSPGCGAAGSGDSVLIYRDSAGQCSAQVRLENGDTYTVSITVKEETIHGACDCSRLVVSKVDAPGPVSIGDGGTD
jgi:hypothetical protein